MTSSGSSSPRTSDDATFDRATVGQTTANIGLAGDLFQEILTSPDALDEIPDDATLVLLPNDDPGLALRNLAMAGRLANRGQTVYLRRAGAAAPARLLRWGPIPDRDTGWSIGYDAETDRVTVRFRGDVSPLARFPISAGIALLVDPETLAVGGVDVPERLIVHLTSGRFGNVTAGTGYRLGPGVAEAYASFVEDLAPLAA